MAKAASNLFSQKKYSMTASIFAALMSLVGPPQKFYGQAKIQIICPVFPDYIPFSCDLTMFHLTVNIGILQSSN